MREELAAVEAERDRLVEMVRLANQRFFGCRSERVVPDQLSLFNDMEAAAEPEFNAQAKPRRRGGRRVVDYSRLEQVVVRHKLPETAEECPECGCGLEEFKIEITYALRMVPAHLVAERHERAVYRCPDCCAANAAGEDAPASIVRAPMPAAPIKGSFATPSLIAYVLNGKYVNALPLYRMEYDFKCLGAPISRQNMANWTMRVWELWLSRLQARMKELLLAGDIIHADETEVQVLKEPGREAKCKSRIWLFAAPACARPIYVYEYNPARSGKVAEDFLRGWSGWLCTDDYRPYSALENGGKVANVACLVHIRRKFAEIVKSAGGDAKAEAAGSVALAARRRIDAMLAVDSGFDDMAAAGDFEGRRLGRERDLRPMMDGFYEWAQARRMEASPRMALDAALRYAIEYWPYAMNALDDGRLEFDNNLAERAIKPFVIGRKNFLFSDARRRGLGGHLLGGHHRQGQRAEPAQIPGMAADRGAERRRPRRPGLPGFPDAMVRFRVGGDQADAGGRGRGRQDGRRPHHRHRPVGLLRRRRIENSGTFTPSKRENSRTFLASMLERSGSFLIHTR